MAERRQWPDGLHAAVEAKEGLRLGADGRILGSITLQHFLGLYPHLAGMTATARPAAEELRDFYGLEVTPVPPHRPCVREDLPDLVFASGAARDRALVAEIRRAHASGRPVLVGTASVAASERLAATLAAAGVPCRVLNARNDEEEAAIVAGAGALGAVTISTNMAGRGTDIRLGGADAADRDRVVGLGGLYVLGTCRHESRRIDDQLRGRAGRQGDPGSSRLFVALDDDLLERHGIRGLLPAALFDPAAEAPLDAPTGAPRGGAGAARRRGGLLRHPPPAARLLADPRAPARLRRRLAPGGARGPRRARSARRACRRPLGGPRGAPSAPRASTRSSAASPSPPSTAAGAITSPRWGRCATRSTW